MTSFLRSSISLAISLAIDWMARIKSALLGLPLFALILAFESVTAVYHMSENRFGKAFLQTIFSFFHFSFLKMAKTSLLADGCCINSKIAFNLRDDVRQSLGNFQRSRSAARQ